MLNTAEYRYIELAIHAFEERVWELSGDKGLAARLGLSKDYLDTLFERWAGVDLSWFMTCLTISQSRKRMMEGKNLLAASLLPTFCCRLKTYPSGQEQGDTLTIKYGFYPSPFGECLLAMSGREICHFSFVDRGEWQLHLQELHKNWPQARIIADEGEDGSHVVEQIFASVGAELLAPWQLLVKGTAFQLKVWQALLAIPGGAMISYQDLAVQVGHPTACRAVAGAVAANPVSYLIPCHRVIRKSGEIHQYRWGSSRKKAMLGWEACRV
jgi:AraC family transcriptional regulator of adaptative response/methylated-DNA-[protein]-cysteine methyltransferase